VILKCLVGSLRNAFMLENIIIKSMNANGRPATMEAVCKLSKPPANVIATDIAPISIPQTNLYLISGVIDPMSDILERINVLESALVTKNKKIKIIASILVNSYSGKCDNNEKRATV